MAEELEVIIDENGEERRCGSLSNPDNFVCAFPTFEATFEVWNDQQIKRVITDQNRVPARKVFGPEWIQNQKSHGSCNGFAESGAYSKARFRRGITDKKLFSGAFAYGLMNNGRDNGSALKDGLLNLQKHGIAEEEYAAWDDIYPSQWKAGARENAAKHKGLVCYAAGTIQGLRTGLAQGFTAIVAVHAGGSFQRLNAQGIAGVDSGGGNHSVHCDDLCVVGGTEVFDMANSWGTGYGTAGRAYLTKDTFRGTFQNHTFYLIGSTEESE